MQIPLIALILIISLAAFSAIRRTRKGGRPRYWAGSSKGRWLLYSGLMLLGISMGIITGITIAAVFGLGEQLSWLIIASILVFTGICAIICHRIENNER
jgi:hypothetical protein